MWYCRKFLVFLFRKHVSITSRYMIFVKFLNLLDSFSFFFLFRNDCICVTQSHRIVIRINMIVIHMTILFKVYKMIFFHSFWFWGNNVLLGFESCCLEYFLGSSVASLIIPKLWGQITFFCILPLTTYALMFHLHITLSVGLFTISESIQMILECLLLVKFLCYDQWWRMALLFWRLKDKWFLQNQVLVTVIQKGAFFSIKKGTHFL